MCRDLQATLDRLSTLLATLEEEDLVQEVAHALALARQRLASVERDSA
jgi:hypothetical protein